MLKIIVLNMWSNWNNNYKNDIKYFYINYYRIYILHTHVIIIPNAYPLIFKLLGYLYDWFNIIFFNYFKFKTIFKIV